MTVDARLSSPPFLPVADEAKFLDRLGRRVERVRTHLCLGIDPDPAGLPAGFSHDAAGIEAFSRLLIESASPYAAAVKVNIAFFEAFGSAGVAALERVRAAIPADIPFIADAKRGDIGTTAARQATALFDSLGADAITANPYLGRDAIAPFLERSDRFVYVLCRTSNPGAATFQNLQIGACRRRRRERAALSPRRPYGFLLVRVRRPGWPGRWSDRAKGASPRSDLPRRGCRSSCRGLVRRAVTSTRCSKTGRPRPATRRPAPVLGWSSACHAASPQPHSNRQIRAKPFHRQLKAGPHGSGARIQACRSTSAPLSC